MANGVTCPNCGLANIAERQTCKRCGTSLREPGLTQAVPVQVASAPPSAEVRGSIVEIPPLVPAVRTSPADMSERSYLLNREILKYLRQGYTVLGRAPDSAQLVRVKTVNGCVVAILSLFGFVPAVAYRFVTGGTEVMDVSVDIRGSVSTAQRVVRF